MARSKSSGRWLQRHVSDRFVHKAREEGYRSRAAYKLIEANNRHRLLIPGAKVVDLGAAPGGWCQVVMDKIGPRGRLVAVDLLEFAPISGATVLKGDFLDEGIQARLVDALGGQADVVLSDMSPNLSGIVSADQARAAELVFMAIEFCKARLSPAGAFFVKIFQGSEFQGLMAELKRTFREVKVIKPEASREESRETYVLARGLREAAKTP